MNTTRFVQPPLPRQKLGQGRMQPVFRPGVGASTQDRQRFIAAVAGALDAPAYVLPNIEIVRWHFDGPLKDADTQATFGASIDPLGSGRNNPPAGCNSVESTMAEPGKFQTWTLIMAIGVHLEPEPLTFTALVNSWTPAPTTGTTQPISPDDFSVADQSTTTGTLGLATGATLIPGVLEWAWWQEKAFWHLSRAYNLIWQWGQSTNLINDSLRYTAYTPSNGQDGGASSSEIDINAYLRQTNQYYVGQLSSPSIALPVDRTRLGNMTLGGNPGLSVYRPTRSYERVGATYGGMGLRNGLWKNAEWRKLSTPFLMKPGVPIGLRMDVSNTDDQTLMQQWFEASCGYSNGTIPGDFTSYANVLVGAGHTSSAVIGAEPSLDTPVAPQGITTITDRVIYKGGTWKMTMALKGFELTDDQAQLVASDSTFRSQLMEGAGCCCVGS